MTERSPWLKAESFLGVVNLPGVDPSRLVPSTKGTFLKVGNNIDIDDEKMVHRRMGREKFYDGPCHSFWSNKKLAFFVENDFLMKLNEDWSATYILDGAGFINGTRMNFLEVGDKIVFSNKSIIGYLDPSLKPYPFPDPPANEPFKKKMVGGHLMEYFNSRLYACQVEKAFYSDAVHPMRMDTRKNFIQLEGFITMFSAVKNGIYASAMDKGTFFLGGSSPKEFTWTKVTDSHAYLYSAIKVEGEDVGDGLLGTVVLWASEEGVFMGGPEGAVKNLTSETYAISDVDEASAIYKFDRGYGQYLCCYSHLPMTGGGEGDLYMPLMKVEGRGTVI